MKTRLLSISFGIASLFGGASAYAASLDVAIPFEFSVYGKMLPAGKYTITVDSANIVMIRGADTAVSLIATPESSTSTKPSAIFDQGSGKSSLAKVNLADGISYTLITSKRPAVTAAATTAGEVLLSRH